MSAPARYDLIAIDLDGTLLCPRGRVSQANIDAIHDARRAGLTVTVCTGRGLVECRHILEQFQQRDPVVVAGGSIVACPDSGSTLHRFAMERPLVQDLVGVMSSHGHAVLVLKDAHAAGHDYLVLSPRGEPDLDPVTRWWFGHMPVSVRFAPGLEHDEHIDHTVRVGICAQRRHTDGVARIVRERFASRASMNHFQAVVPDSTDPDPESQTLILEVFSPAASKWAAIEHLADRRNIPHHRIAAIGNDINDVAMLQRAACGVAMGNAIEEARAVADRHTLGNDADGVAHAIGRILAGEW